MDFEFFYMLTERRNENDDWRMRKIWHTTSTGQRNKVRVKSLPANDQWKYAPLSVKMRRAQEDSTINTETPSHPKDINRRLFKVYYSANRDKEFDKFYKGKLVVVTDDPSKAMDIEKKGHIVAIANQVPIDAFKKLWDYDKKSWVDFPKDITDEEKFELIRWTDNDVYLCDLFEYKDGIDFKISSDVD